MHEGADTVRFLSGATARIAILERLRQHGPASERELRERLDAARSTVHRNVRALEERGWIRQSEGRYRITPTGVIVSESYEDLVETVATVDRLQPFLERLPPSKLDFDVRLLADAELTIGTPGNPLAVLTRHVQRLKHASTVHAVLPRVSLHPYEVQHRRVIAGALEATHVVTTDVAETLRTDESLAPLTGEMLATDRFDLYVYDGEVPYMLGIVDDRIHLAVDDGESLALIECAAESIGAWARETYRGYRRAARAVPGGSFVRGARRSGIDR